MEISENVRRCSEQRRRWAKRQLELDAIAVELVERSHDALRRSREQLAGPPNFYSTGNKAPLPAPRGRKGPL